MVFREDFLFTKKKTTDKLYRIIVDNRIDTFAVDDTHESFTIWI